METLQKQTRAEEMKDYKKRLATIRKIWEPRYEHRGIVTSFKNNVILWKDVNEDIRGGVQRR